MGAILAVVTVLAILGGVTLLVARFGSATNDQPSAHLPPFRNENDAH